MPDRVSNPGPPTYESGALPIALHGPADKQVKLLQKYPTTLEITLIWWIQEIIKKNPEIYTNKTASSQLPTPNYWVTWTDDIYLDFWLEAHEFLLQKYFHWPWILWI